MQEKNTLVNTYKVCIYSNNNVNSVYIYGKGVKVFRE